MLTGGEVISKVFTMTLIRCLQQSQLLHAHIEVVLRDVSSFYAAVEALKAWLEALLADWVDKMVLWQCVDLKITQVFNGLMQNVYGLIAWEHIARAFRVDY